MGLYHILLMIIFNDPLHGTHLYKMVVFPAPSKPRIKIRRSFVPHNLENKLENSPPTYVEYAQL